MEHPPKLTRRAMQEKPHPCELLEADAKEALTVMYQIATGKSVVV